MSESNISSRKRKNYLSLTKTSRHYKQTSFFEPSIPMVFYQGHEFVNQTAQVSDCIPSSARTCYIHPQRRTTRLFNKENGVPSRGIIKIKPKKFINSSHFLWSRQRLNRSELVQLEREELQLDEDFE